MWLEKKNQIEINYIVQLIINQILSDEIKKNKLENLKKNTNCNRSKWKRKKGQYIGLGRHISPWFSRERDKCAGME